MVGLNPRRSAAWLALLGWLVVAAGSQAAFLRNVPQVLTQPDGTVVHLLATGDEYYNRLHDAAGFTVVRDPDTGVLVYAVKQDGELLPSAFPVGSVDPAAVGLVPNLLPDARLLPSPAAEYPPGRRPLVRAQGLESAPAFSQINNIVVFIRFSDETGSWQPTTTYDTWFNASGSGATSMRAFFLEASYGQLTLDSTFYPTPNGTTVLSYQDSHPRAYYKPYNATTNPQGYKDSERAQREHVLLGNAINAITAQVPGTIDVDTNQDGYVDSVVFMVDGFAAQADWSNLLWPHRWAMSSDYPVTVKIHGKVVDDYDLQLNGNLLGSGVLCHEMTHTLGAPDLYRYDTCSTDTSIDSVGAWDLMSNDRQPPQHMGSYLKWRYLGFISDIPEIASSGTYQLHPLTSSTNNCYKIASPNTPTEYFLLEYRRKTGPFESSVPGSGLLVYRIDTAADGQGNMCGPPDEEYVYRPDGSLTSNGTVNNAAFSADKGRTAINDSTNPSSFLSDGNPGGLSISNVGSVGDTISFQVNIQTACVPDAFSLVSPANGAALSAATTSTQLTWNAAANATSYDVYFGTTPNPPVIANQAGTSRTVTVANGKTYYWKVLAKNSCGPTPAPASGLWAFNVGGASGELTILSDDFEGSFPGQWQVAYTSGAVQTAWGKVACKTASGSGAAWCAAGGSQPRPACTSYVASMGTFLYYGPFSLTDAVEGRLDFDLWTDINDGGDPSNPPDAIYWMFSLDGNNFYGEGYTGNSGGWQHKSILLSDVSIGDTNPVPLLGHSQIWLAFVFISSSSTTPKGGAYLDNVMLEKMLSPSCSYALAQNSLTIDAAGGSGSVGVTSSWSNCPWTAASNAAWITISGGASGAGDGTVTFTVEANTGAARSGTLTIAGQTFTVNQGASTVTQWLPAVIHKDVPSRNAWWRSDVAVLNRSAQTANLTLTIYAPSGTKTKSMQVGPHAQLLLHDVAGQLGITADSGALRVDSDQPISLTGRTYSQVDATHTYGQDYDGVASSQLPIGGHSEWLPQLTQNAYYRTNIGITNTGSTTANVTVTLYDASGDPAGWSDTRDYAPAEFYQYDQPFLLTPAGTIDSGYAVVTVNSGSGVDAYASVIDQQTGDPTTIAMQYTCVGGPCGFAPGPLWLPAVIHKDVPSRNAWWRSDVALLNLGGTTNLTFTIFAPSGTKSQTFQVDGNSQMLLRDVAGQLGITADSGALEVQGQLGLYGVMLTGRTYSQVDATHTYGQDYDSQSAQLTNAGDTGWLQQLTQNAYYRTNIGIVNTGTTTANVTVTLYDASGNPAGWSDTRDYAPGQFYQHDQPFLHTPAGVMDSGYAVVTLNSGSGVVATASVIDQQTGDPTTIHMKP
jgi:M6 family metalloprotease-like protein